ncbi:LEA type 2 family protein [Haloplanus halobius]|uniref:LEA type 2 family protein n=1 Tax=Haloplanus halobius TaxID=2934938 RepID=UPI00200E9434|nr:LEA type 2 family protein [Haloplanus sp. XH21]
MLSRLRERLSTKRILALGIVVVVLLAGGAFVLFSQPSVSGIDNRFGDVNDTTTVVESDLHVRNPNPIGASLGGLRVDYAIDMNGVRMATGAKEGLSLPKGNSTIPLTTRLSNDRIPPWWVSHIRNGERTELAVSADVHSSTLGASAGAPKVTRTIETDIISAFNSTERRPVGEEQGGGEPVLYIEETSAEWGTVDSSTTNINMTFVVYNPNPYPVPISELSYRATMNDIEMGTGATENPAVIPPNGTRTIHATTRLNNDNIDEWWVTHLENNQTTDLRIDFAAQVELPTGTIEIPLDPLTYTRTIETDIFGSKTETASGSNEGTESTTPTPSGENEGTATPSEDGTATPTPTETDGGLLDDGTETTSTETATATATPTPTETDGGLLSMGVSTATQPVR